MSLSKAARNVMSGRTVISEDTATPQNRTLPAEGKLAAKANAPKAKGKPPGPPAQSTTVKPTGGVTSDDAKKVAHQTKKSAEPQAAKKTGDLTAEKPQKGTPQNEEEEVVASEELAEDEEVAEEEGDDRPETKLGQAKAIFDALRELEGDDLDGKYASIMSAIYEDEQEGEDEGDYEVEIEGSEAVHITAEDLDVSEDIAALVGAEDLSEEFMAKAKTIFEGAVVSKVNEAIDAIHAQYETDLVESVTAFAEELTEKVDGYLSYAVEEWMKVNELAIDSGIRNEVAEGFINGLKDLFTQHYIDIPEEKVDVVEALAVQVDELEQGLNETIEQNIDLQKEVNEGRKIEVLIQACDGLADTQIEKLRGLAEGVEFEDIDQYHDALSTLKESYFPKAPRMNAEEEVEHGTLLNEEENKPNLSPDMAAYSRVIGRTIRK